MRQRDGVGLGLVGRHDGRTAGDGDHGDATGARGGGLGEEGGGLHQRLEILHHHGAGPFEGGEVGGLFAGERAGVGHRGGRAGLAGAELEDHQRLVGGIGDFRGLDEAHRVGHALEDAGDGAAGRVIGEVGDAIRDVDIGGIAGGQQVADRDAAHHRLRQREAERAGLADQADGMRQRRFHRRRDHEGDAGLGFEVQHADAVRADDAHAGVTADLREAELGGDVGLPARLRIARRIEHDATDAGLRAVDRDLLHRILGDDEDAAIGHLRQRGDRGEAGALADFLVARIHQIEPAGIVLQRLHGAVGEGARAWAGADHGDGRWVEQAPHLTMAVDGAARGSHVVASPGSLVTGALRPVRGA